VTTIDLLFPVVGTRLPVDHGYALYGAISRLLPALHDGSLRFGMAPVTGPHVGNGLLQVDSTQSRLRLRLSATDIPQVLPLAGKGLDVMGHRIRLGVPQIRSLQPVPSLIARTVAIKKATAPDTFLDSAQRQLDELGIGGRLRVPERLGKAGHREPARRVLRIKDVRIVGYSLLVEDLSESDSLKLQAEGLGGRRHLGCGLFVAAREGGAA
jgi:CRISPR-associated endonuclease/helicase Cas3